VATKFTKVFADENGNGVYLDKFQRFHIGYRDSARVFLDGKMVKVENRLQFLMFDTLGSPIAEDYEVDGKTVDDLNETPEAEPEKEKAKTAAVCAREGCNTPLNEAQVKRGGKYCSTTCRDLARSDK